jgi:hypothetical protein
MLYLLSIQKCIIHELSTGYQQVVDKLSTGTKLYHSLASRAQAVTRGRGRIGWRAQAVTRGRACTPARAMRGWGKKPQPLAQVGTPTPDFPIFKIAILIKHLPHPHRFHVATVPNLKILKNGIIISAYEEKA